MNNSKIKLTYKGKLGVVTGYFTLGYPDVYIDEHQIKKELLNETKKKYGKGSYEFALAEKVGSHRDFCGASSKGCLIAQETSYYKVYKVGKVGDTNG